MKIPLLRYHQKAAGFLTGVAFFAALISSGQAAPILVSNPSFELPVLPPDTNAILVASPGFPGGTPLPGWTTYGGYIAIANAQNISDNGGPATIPDGTQAIGIFGNLGSHISQTTSAGLLADTTYTLSIDVTRLNQPAGLGITLSAGSEFSFSVDGYGEDGILASSSLGSNILSASWALSSNVNQATWSTLTLTVVTGSAVVDPGNLSITVQSAIGSNPGFWSPFDNVRLDAVTVPEPGTLGMLSVGAVGIFAFCSRKRTRFLQN